MWVMRKAIPDQVQRFNLRYFRWKVQNSCHKYSIPKGRVSEKQGPPIAAKKNEEGTILPSSNYLKQSTRFRHETLVLEKFQILTLLKNPTKNTWKTNRRMNRWHGSVSTQMSAPWPQEYCLNKINCSKIHMCFHPCNHPCKVFINFGTPIGQYHFCPLGLAG